MNKNKMTTLDDLEDLLRRGEKERAYELIKEAKGITAEILMNEGIYFGTVEEHSISISYFELVEKIAEDDKNKEIARENLAMTYYNRGNAYREIKQHEKAIEDYNKAIELNPKYAMAYNNRGNAYREIKQHERAIEEYNKAIELNPNLAMAYNNRGVAYCEIKQHERAIEEYNKAIELNPNLAMAYNNRGIAYREIKQHEKAIEDYNKAIELNPKYAWAYNNRGNAYCEIKQHERAIEDYNKAIELSPNLAQPYANRGFTRLQANEDLDKAIEDFKCARDLSEGKEKDRMLGFIEWVKARKEMNMKNWGDFRERMNEAKEIFEKINDPLSHSIDTYIKFSYLDEKLDNALNIPDPIKALEEIETVLKNPPKVEELIGSEGTIFDARITSFAILSEFIGLVKHIDENTDSGVVKAKLTELLEDSREVEEAFESVNFVKGKTAIVDIQEIISLVKQEMEEIKWAANKKQKALEILKKYWSRLSSAIKMMNGVSTRETENITLGREIKSELRVGFAETKEIISKGFEKSSEEHKEILEKIYETENILMQKDVINARYRIEFPPPPSPAKIIVDIPIGKLTEKQIEEKAEEIAYKFKYLRGKVKKEFLGAIKRIPEMGDKLLKRLKKTKG